MPLGISENYYNLLYPWIWSDNNVVILSQKKYDNEKHIAQELEVNGDPPCGILSPHIICIYVGFMMLSPFNLFCVSISRFI